MGNLFNYNNPLIQTINKIADCVILSLLWLLFSVPIITSGASTTALYYTVNKVIRHERSSLLKEFWRAFKSNFKQSTIVWLILMVTGYVLGIDFIFVYNLIVNKTISAWVLAPFVMTALFVVMWTIYVFPYIARFQNGLKAIIKNCAILVITHFLKSVLLVLLFAVSIVALLYLPISILCIPVLSMLLASLILENIFKKYMSDEDLAAEEARNRISYN